MCKCVIGRDVQPRRRRTVCSFSQSSEEADKFHVLCCVIRPSVLGLGLDRIGLRLRYDMLQWRWTVAIHYSIALPTLSVLLGVPRVSFLPSNRRYKHPPTCLILLLPLVSSTKLPISYPLQKCLDQQSFSASSSLHSCCLGNASRCHRDEPGLDRPREEPGPDHPLLISPHLAPPCAENRGTRLCTAPY